MKKSKSSFYLFFVFSLVLASCGKSPEKQIVKTWLVSDIETPAPLPDSLKTQMISGSQITFTKDGQYTATGGIGADQGSYTLDKEGKSLSTISQAGKSNSVYTIKKLSDDELVLNNNGNTVTCTAKK